MTRDSEVFHRVKLCRSRAAHEVIPTGTVKLNLTRVAEEVEEKRGWKVVSCARILLQVEASCPVTIFPSGRLLVRTKEEEEANRVACEFSEVYFHPSGALR